MYNFIKNKQNVLQFGLIVEKKLNPPVDKKLISLAV
jgi:hypothetical protein